MKFLINMNLPRGLARRLAEMGHACRHVGDIGMAEADDAAIVLEARRTGEVILTHDLDYGGLLAFSGKPKPSVVILRMRSMSIDNVSGRLASSWPRICGQLESGAIVVFEDAVVRVRSLPIAE